MSTSVMEAQLLTWANTPNNLMLTFVKEVAGGKKRGVQITAIGLDGVDDLLAAKTPGDRSQLALYGARGVSPQRIFDAAVSARRDVLRESAGGQRVAAMPLTELFGQIGKAKAERAPSKGDLFRGLFITRRGPGQG